jgi:hypothetical protein
MSNALRMVLTVSKEDLLKEEAAACECQESGQKQGPNTLNALPEFFKVKAGNAQWSPNPVLNAAGF